MALRDAVEAAVNTVEEAREAPVTPEVKAEPQVEAKLEATETALPETPAEGRTAGRARDDKGRLLPGKADAPEKVTAKVETPPAAIATPAEPAKPKTPPPSSWKKDHWGDWEKISTENPTLAQYLTQREGEFAKGVSTYKTDYDGVKPLKDAMAPYEPFLRQNNLKPEQAISALMQTDQTLRFGNPQEKLRTFARMVQDYQIPVNDLLVQGEDGKVYFNQQYFQQQAQQTASPGLTAADVDKLVQQRMAQVQIQTAVQQFQTAKDKDGHPLYPHFDTVRQTMDGLLRAGLAQDLTSAYDKALRMHDDIWQAEQTAKQAATQKAAQEAQAKQVAKAKATATSPRTATPAADTGAKPKGIREALGAAIDAHTQGGRV